MGKNVGFISTRFAGTDGVSLESAKWAEVLWRHEHVSYWYAGRLDRAPEISMCVPEAFFGHPEVEWINQRIWGRSTRSPLVTQRIHSMTEYLKSTLYRFVEHFSIDILVVENALTIPMHVPLGLAITEFIAETDIPVIAHHHDFYWERTRFSINAAGDYLEMAFPPRNRQIQHVVINIGAEEELSWRKGLTALLIPNVLNFEEPPQGIDDYNADVREAIGLKPDDVMILQPTRVVPRKGIEHAISLVAMLDDPRYKLVISHEAGDEGTAYLNAIKDLAAEAGVDLRFVDDRIGDRRQINSDGQKIYTLWDLYPHAGMVTYPSLYEGFGNALLEAFYFRVPILINRYSIFTRDIEPRGFQAPIMEGYITRQVVEEVRRILEDPEYRQQMVEHNFQVARRFFSYEVLRRNLRTLITNITGLEDL